MIRRIDPLDAATAAALVDVQRAAYALEAALLGVPSLPPMTETPAELAASGLRVLATDELTAFVAWERDGDVVDVHRLVTHPGHLRQGHATRLLDALEREEAGARRFVVGTGAANAPALALYERRGYRRVAEELVGDGIPYVRLEKGGG